jgi:hypothetical protein
MQIQIPDQVLSLETHQIIKALLPQDPEEFD